MLKKLKNKIHILQNVYLKNNYFFKKKSYAMDGEDIAIQKYVKHTNNGFYVDVGSHHPLQRSNTYLLYQTGWRGINVDINDFTLDLFNAIFIKIIKSRH
jgi:hypothetical protein